MLFSIATVFGQGHNWIYQRNTDLQEPADYEIVQLLQRVVIHTNGSGETFEFQAVIEDESHHYYGPGDIQTITADENLGDLTITLVGHEGRTLGARDVGEINLLPTDTFGHVTALHVRNLGDAAHEIALIADSAGTLRLQPSGIPVATGGDLVKPLDISGSVTRVFVGGSILFGANVLIAGDVGTLEVYGDVSDQVRIVAGSAGGGNLGTLNIYGYLAACLHTDGDIDTVEIVTLAGTLDVGGSLGDPSDPHAVVIYYLHPQGLIHVAGSITGPVSFAPFMCGELEVQQNVLAPIEAALRNVGGEVVSTSDVTGRIVVTGELRSSIYTPGSLLHVPCVAPVDGGQIVIDGAVTENGSIEIGQDVDGGQIEVGSLAAGAEIAVGRNVFDGGTVSVSDDLAGALIIDGDLGANEGTACSVSAGDLVSGGHVIVNGSLPGTGSITIGGTPDEVWDDEFITIGYDGPPVSWFAPATVTVNDGPQAGVHDWHTPEHHIFLIGCKRGDLNSDRAVNAADLAIYNATIYPPAAPPDTFCAAYPWYCGALHYLGDADCDGAVTGSPGERAALELKITDPNQWYWEHLFCEMGCLFQGGGGFFFGGYDFEFGGGDFGLGADGLGAAGEAAAAEGAMDEDAGADGGMSPDEMAGILRALVDPERLADVIALCQQAAAAATDPDVAAFWAEVAELLAE